MHEDPDNSEGNPCHPECSEGSLEILHLVQNDEKTVVFGLVRLKATKPLQKENPMVGKFIVILVAIILAAQPASAKDWPWERPKSVVVLDATNPFVWTSLIEKGVENWNASKAKRFVRYEYQRLLAGSCNEAPKPKRGQVLFCSSEKVFLENGDEVRAAAYHHIPEGNILWAEVELSNTAEFSSQITRPSTVCHELAHSAGLMDEDYPTGYSQLPNEGEGSCRDQDNRTQDTPGWLDIQQLKKLYGKGDKKHKNRYNRR